ncbi:MAG: FAD-dependent oxidoreductase [Candidatus Adiutrix sp.]|jgi:NADPH-dependent 2,4-dienoyl-CoA reductase/sulfur reductase-like enzyme|nr:FAD-dependent oxidoreductase [Candidatus Adiutrix sp.]
MRILIVGGDAAGMSAASQIRRRQPSWAVEVFEAGQRTSYALCGTPYYLGGVVREIDQLVTLTPEQFARERGIPVHTGHLVTAVNPARKSITVKDLATGQSRDEAYDRLLLATGAEALMPTGLEPGPAGLFYLRSLDDAENIRRAMGKAKSAVVVGAGYIGLEVAENMVEAGLEVTLLGRQPAPIFEEELQALAAQALSRPGLTFRSMTDAVGLSPAPSGGLTVAVSQGEAVPAAVGVVGAGVRPRAELAAAAGLTLGVKQAISVDRFQKTSDPFIYAAGDCAESYHRLSGAQTWVALALGANRQGRVAGFNLCDEPEEFPGILGTSIMKIFGLALARTGLGLEEARRAGFPEAVKTVVKQHSKPGYYPGSTPVTVIIIADRATGRLLGGQMGGTLEGVGQRINTLAAALSTNMTVKEASGLDTAYAPPFAPVHDPVVIACEVAAKNLKG